ANRRKYGAKELTPDLGLNTYDFEARMLYPALCSWTIQDPEQEQYYDISSYAFCHNNPVMFVDPSGKTDFFVQETNERKHVDDNVNQVIEISSSDYQTLVFQGFDSTTEEYSKIVANGIQRTDLFPTVEDVLAGKDFVPYKSTYNCFENAKKQNNSATTGPMNRIDLYNEDENTFNYSEGVEYIKSQLLNGNSVITGVSYSRNNKNRNSSTSHFLNIVGMGFEIGKNGTNNYFMYYDNATNDKPKGTNLERNRLYEDTRFINKASIPVLLDKSNLCVDGAKIYIVTEVRRNK
ncbi:MAG: RHS repeat-associated core domain-containing protein, partial [Muribaculaceae bacterium]